MFETQIMVVTPQIRNEARMVLRILAGQRKPLVLKTGEYWSAWDGKGRIRPYRSWTGAMRAALNG